MAAIHHEDPELIVHASPARPGSILGELFDEFDPEPERGPVEGELPADLLGALFPRTFLRLFEWARP
jgi:hypothetical protein